MMFTDITIKEKIVPQVVDILGQLLQNHLHDYFARNHIFGFLANTIIIFITINSYAGSN